MSPVHGQTVATDSANEALRLEGADRPPARRGDPMGRLVEEVRLLSCGLEADGHQVGRVDPLVGKGDAARLDDGVAQWDRP